MEPCRTRFAIDSGCEKGSEVNNFDVGVKLSNAGNKNDKCILIQSVHMHVHMCTHALCMRPCMYLYLHIFSWSLNIGTCCDNRLAPP